MNCLMMLVGCNLNMMWALLIASAVNVATGLVTIYKKELMAVSSVELRNTCFCRVKAREQSKSTSIASIEAKPSTLQLKRAPPLAKIIDATCMILWGVQLLARTFFVVGVRLATLGSLSVAGLPN